MSADERGRRRSLAARPTLLFLHGGGLNGAMWLPQMRSLGADLKVLAVDFAAIRQGCQVPVRIVNGRRDRLNRRGAPALAAAAYHRASRRQDTQLRIWHTLFFDL